MTLRNGRAIIIEGVRYPSLEAAERLLGAKPGSVAVELAAGMECPHAGAIVDGRRYARCLDADAAMGWQPGCASALIALGIERFRGHSVRPAAACAPERRRGEPRPVTIDGVDYPSLCGACYELGWHPISLRRALARGERAFRGRSVSYAEHPVEQPAPKNSPVPVLVDGRLCRSMHEADAACGTSEGAVSRALRMGQARIRGHEVAYAIVDGDGDPAAAKAAY